MEAKKDSKRRKETYDEDDRYQDRRSKRQRSRSQSPVRYWDNTRRKRKNSRSRTPEASVKQEKTASNPKDIESKKQAPERKAKDTDMLNTRTGGAYIPPARLRMMQAQITDKSSVAYQRIAWEALKKSIHGHINKINVGNIGIIIKELLKENIVRGRGLLCRSVIQAQAASPTFTNVYAALVAAVNSRFPNIGELLLKRLVIQFKRGFKRNDKPICISSASFIAHLVNQRVAHEILALELLTLLVESPTDDSVEVAIAFLKECGQKLTEVSSKGVNAIFEMLRNILHEGQLDKRVQYMIEVMFQVWKDGFKDHPALIEELELVPEEEQFTHLLMLDDATDSQDILNVFKFDEKYEENEQKYKTLSKEILGSDAESGEEDGSDESGSEESEEEEAEGEQKGVTIIDNTETNLVALRRTIYLTINSSLDFEECAHKLMKMQLKPGQEVELCHMFLDCCAEQRTYEKFYGLLAQRFCNINRIYIGPFEEIFKDSYGTAHRLDTNRLRNVSKFFAHLLFTDSISWEVLECVKLNEEDTTSSSRIYIKILFQELAEYMGLKKLNDRLKDPTLQEAFAGIFPRDNPKNTRFSINFFTSIGLGGLTDELREHLKQMPKNVPAQVTEINVDSESDSDSSSSSSSSSDDSSDSSSSESDEEENKKKKSKKDKNKEKDPKPPEGDADKQKNTERWGHDGFYDTYGKDARRTESRPERVEKDRNNFAVPRDVARRNDNSRDNRERNDRNYDRRNDDRRRPEDRNGHADVPDRKNRDDRGDSRRDRDQDRRQSDYQNRDRSDEASRSRREERDRERQYSDRRDEDDHRRNKGDTESRSRNESRSRRDEDSSGSKRVDGPKEDARNKNEGRNRRDAESDEEVSKSRKDVRGRDVDKDEHRRTKGDTESRSRNESRSRRDEDSSGSKRVDGPKEDARNKKEARNRRDADSDEEVSKSRRDERGRDVDKNGSSKKNKKKDSSSEESSEDEKSKNRRKKHSKASSDDERNKKKEIRTKEKSKRDDKKRNDDSSDDETEKRHDKKQRKKDRENTPDSEEESREKKNNKDKKRPEMEDSEARREDRRKNRDDSDDEDPKQRKRDKERRKGKENSRDGKKEDGWDIKRGSSIRRELGNRYWD